MTTMNAPKTQPPALPGQAGEQSGKQQGRRFDARAQQRRIEAVFNKPPSRGKLSLAAIGLIWTAAAAYYLLQCLRFGCGAVTLCDDSRII